MHSTLGRYKKLKPWILCPKSGTIIVNMLQILNPNPKFKWIEWMKIYNKKDIQLFIVMQNGNYMDLLLGHCSWCFIRPWNLVQWNGLSQWVGSSENKGRQEQMTTKP